MFNAADVVSMPVSFQVAALLGAAILAAVYVTYRVVRYAVRGAGRFAEWVCDDAARARIGCYSLAAVLGVSGMFTAGVGISRVHAFPEKILNDQQRRKQFMDDIATRMANTHDRDRLEALKHLADTYDKNYDRYRSDNPSATTSDARDYPPGAPLLCGGLGMVVVGVLLCVRTAAKYD
jgi:hypothetical protein